MNVFVPFPLSLSGPTGQRLDAELLGKLRRLLCPKAGGLLFLSSAHHRESNRAEIHPACCYPKRNSTT